MNQTAPIAPPADVAYAHKLGRGMLLDQQIEELVKAINPDYVETKQRLTYLAQHQARAEMNRIFGYGNWDVQAGDPTLIYEYTAKGSGQNASKDYWFVAYRIRVVVEIRDLWGMPVATYTGVHAEENAPQPNRGEAHALALTSVDSYAIRRALINLGDRFGLGLYNGGSTLPHGQYTIQQAAFGTLRGWAQPAPQAAPQQQTPQQAPPQSPQMQNFSGVQQELQAQREDARANAQALTPDMAERMQAQMKHTPGGGAQPNG